MMAAVVWNGTDSVETTGLHDLTFKRRTIGLGG